MCILIKSSMKPELWKRITPQPGRRGAIIKWTSPWKKLEKLRPGFTLGGYL
jgi:hypothetical protein